MMFVIALFPVIMSYLFPYFPIFGYVILDISVVLVYIVVISVKWIRITDKALDCCERGKRIIWALVNFLSPFLLVLIVVAYPLLHTADMEIKSAQFPSSRESPNRQDMSYKLAQLSSVVYAIDKECAVDKMTPLLTNQREESAVPLVPSSCMQHRLQMTLDDDEWKIDLVFHDSTTTYSGGISGAGTKVSALVASNAKDSTVVLVFAGTMDLPTLLWEDFFQIGTVHNTTESVNAMQIGNFLYKATSSSTQSPEVSSSVDLSKYQHIYFTGHSLGGYLAAKAGSQWLLEATGEVNPNKQLARVAGIETFNSPTSQFRHQCLSDDNSCIAFQHFAQSSEDESGISKVISHQIEGDRVSALGSHPGTVILYPLKNSGFWRIWDAHYLEMNFLS